MDWLFTTDAAALAGFLVVTLLVGGVAGFATRRGVTTWYPTLAKPSFNPPNVVFAPVWTVLYILMAIAAWRVWCVTGLAALPLYLFALQLVLNAAWSILFFNAHRIVAALWEMVALWLCIVATMVAFWQVDPIAGALFVPYVAWVSFAMLLNGAVLRLNGPRHRHA